MKKGYSKIDKIILESYKKMVEGLSDYLADGYEIVLHSLERLDQSVIKIMNGQYSGRSEGSPITDMALEMLSRIEHNEGDQKYLTYFNRDKKGVLMKSSTISIEGEKGRIIGLLCINFYTDTPIGSIVRGLIDTKTNVIPVETFNENSQELVLNVLEDSKTKIYNDITISSTNKNREIISCLYNKGIFNLKDAVAIVANNLGISKNTVYMHIRGLSDKKKEPGGASEHA